MDPQSSSYKSYLVTQKLPLQVKDENCPHISKIIKDVKFDVLKVVDCNTKEEESFLFNYIGNDGLHYCLKTILNDFFSKVAHQTVLVFMDVLNNVSPHFDKEIEDIFHKEAATHKIENLKVSTFEIAFDTYTDFVSGNQTSLTEADFTYFDCKVVKLREILKFFKTRQRSGWQAFVIRINYTISCHIQKLCNIVFLNPELSTVNDGEDIIPVNRSLTAILNCHYEPQLNCGFTKFIYTLTRATNVSVVVKYPSQEHNFMGVKTVLFHSCFKYVNSSDPGEILKSKTKTGEYIKRLRTKIIKIEKETRAKIVKELSDFYFQQYSVLKENYAKALSQIENSRDASENMENASFSFNHSIAVQNFSELGDCSSKIKGLVYLIFETQRQFKCFIVMNNELLKNKKDSEKYLEEKNESLEVMKMEIENLEKEKARLLNVIEVKDMEMTEQKQKTYRVVKHYQRAVKFYQTSRVTDQEIIKANRKEIHSLLRYINQLRKKESGRTSENVRSNPPFSKMIQLKYFRKSQSPSAIKNCIKERRDYYKDDDNTKVNNVTNVSEVPFVRIRVQK
ncbi:uncharacterized protein LOC108733808 isoform X2 [Agrilus planipennis]|nr:uncharacterized protein LOC108733808 isoform X2 [Agrilus planipennis]